MSSSAKQTNQGAVHTGSARASVGDWLQVLRACAEKVGPAMGLPPCQVLATLKTPPKGLSGMGIKLEGAKPYVMIGVLSNPAGRAAIACAIFQMTEDQQPNESDEADAVGELVNVLSGHVKAEMRAIDQSMRLGLPAPIDATGFAANAEHATLRVSFGTVPVALVVTLL